MVNQLQRHYGKLHFMQYRNFSTDEDKDLISQLPFPMNQTIEINEARLQEIQAACIRCAVIGTMLVTVLLSPIVGVSLSSADGDSLLFR